MTARTAVEELIVRWEKQGRALLTAEHAAAELRDALEEDYGLPAEALSSPYVLHYTGQQEAGTSGEWTVYRRDADPYPSYGPGEFTGLHSECVRWLEEHP